MTKLNVNYLQNPFSKKIKLYLKTTLTTSAIALLTNTSRFLCPQNLSLKTVLITRKSEPKTEESIAERTKLRRERIAEIERKEKSINNKLFDYYFGYSNPSNIRNRLINVTGETKKIG